MLLVVAAVRLVRQEQLRAARELWNENSVREKRSPTVALSWSVKE